MGTAVVSSGSAYGIGGYLIPPKTLIFITPFITRRDPKYWHDPETFDPDRFTAEQVASHTHYHYYPFGEGPHVCIGNNFALMEMQSILATALSDST